METKRTNRKDLVISSADERYLEVASDLSLISVTRGRQSRHDFSPCVFHKDPRELYIYIYNIRICGVSSSPRIINLISRDSRYSRAVRSKGTHQSSPRFDPHTRCLNSINLWELVRHGKWRRSPLCASRARRASSRAVLNIARV